MNEREESHIYSVSGCRIMLCSSCSKDLLSTSIPSATCPLHTRAAEMQTVRDYAVAAMLARMPRSVAQRRSPLVLDVHDAMKSASMLLPDAQVGPIATEQIEHPVSASNAPHFPRNRHRCT